MLNRKNCHLYSIHSNTAKKTPPFGGGQIGTTFTQNERISLTTDLKNYKMLLCSEL